MKLKNRMAARVAAGLVIAVAAAQPAHADVTITDTTGDTDTTLVCVDVCVQPGLAPYQPAIDITTATIAEDGTSLVFSIGVVDLDHPGTGEPWATSTDRTLYSFGFTVSGTQAAVRSNRDFGHSVSTGSLQVGMLSTPVTFAFDDVANITSMTVPVADLDALVRQACATCAPVGEGSVLSGISIAGQVMKQVGEYGVGMISGIDYANTDDTFTI